MYLDEAGDHSLTVIDPKFPVFVLGGVIVDRNYLQEVVDPAIRELKRAFFHRSDFCLHTAEIIRATGPFQSLKDPLLKAEFLDALTLMMQELEYKVVACAIKKPEHLLKYGEHAVDPYSFSLEVLVERFCHEIGTKELGGIIYAERRRPDLDRALEVAWERLKVTGTDFVSDEDISTRVLDLVLKDKSVNSAGLQLADLVVSPIGRAVIGYPTRQDWNVVESKFRRRGNTYKGYGLVVLPR